MIIALRIQHLHINQIQITLLSILQISSNLFPKKTRRQCQEDHLVSSRKQPNAPTPFPTTTMEDGGKADGGLHLGSSFGAETHYGITGFQWATMLMVFIAIIWLLLRYKRKSSIASDAKRGILPPIHKRKAQDGTTAPQGNAECSQCKNATANQPTKEWLAHAIVRTAEHSTVTKTNRSCWSRCCWGPLETDTVTEYHPPSARHQMVTILGPGTPANSTLVWPRREATYQSDRFTELPDEAAHTTHFQTTGPRQIRHQSRYAQEAHQDRENGRATRRWESQQSSTWRNTHQRHSPATHHSSYARRRGSSGDPSQEEQNTSRTKLRSWGSDCSIPTSKAALRKRDQETYTCDRPGKQPRTSSPIPSKEPAWKPTPKRSQSYQAPLQFTSSEEENVKVRSMLQ